jgi:hypothetical protein
MNVDNMFAHHTPTPAQNTDGTPAEAQAPHEFAAQFCSKVCS